MLRSCLAAAAVDGTVCVFLEPIALYHTRDLFDDNDEGWLAPATGHAPIGTARVYGDVRRSYAEFAEDVGRFAGALVRAGVEPGAPAVGLAQAIAASQALRFAGVMGWEGQTVHMQDLAAKQRAIEASVALLTQSADAIRAAGLPEL